MISTGSMPKMLQGKRKMKKRKKPGDDAKGTTSADRHRSRGGRR